jgi:hypothetical protein
MRPISGPALMRDAVLPPGKMRGPSDSRFGIEIFRAKSSEAINGMWHPLQFCWALAVVKLRALP